MEVLRIGEALGVFGIKSKKDLLIDCHMRWELKRGAQGGSKVFVLSNWKNGIAISFGRGN